MKCDLIKQTQHTTHSANRVVFTSAPLSLSTFREIVCLPRFGCLLSYCVWSYPRPTPPFSPSKYYPTPLPHRRQHILPQAMSHSKPVTPVITPTLHDHPRTNLVPWKVAINRAARGILAEWHELTAVSGLPAHIVMFRGHLARVRDLGIGYFMVPS